MSGPTKSQIIADYAMLHGLAFVDIPLSAYTHIHYLERQAQANDMSAEDILEQIVESNDTGCLNPDEHQGRCGYSLRNCPNEGCENKLNNNQEITNGECMSCTIHDAIRYTAKAVSHFKPLADEPEESLITEDPFDPIDAMQWVEYFAMYKDGTMEVEDWFDAIRFL